MEHDKYIGRLLDNRYEILEVIGTGGMAMVYKARCHRLNRLVAMKILKDDLSQDDEFRRRFHAESQAVAMLSHPNIMSVYDVSTTDEADYIVMELIDGITLKQYMEKKGVLNWKETLHFSMQIAKALEHAHSRGIVHRDIKPHNIMVLKNGSVKVTDFGIARIMSKSNTLTKEALGSVHYISPEQAKGGRVDNRSDLYSLGVVMYEMMTGRPPYDGESPVSVAIQHINGGAAMPSTLNPNIPGGLEQIIMKVMAVDPGKRYHSATALLYDMEEFRKDPSILFDFNNTPVDDAVRFQNAYGEKTVQQPRSTAERVAGVRSERPSGGQSNGQRQRSGQSPSQRSGQSNPGRGSQNPSQRGGQSGQRQNPPSTDLTSEQARRRAARERERREQEESRTRTITIAVIACSGVAIIAIIIFLVMLLNGGVFGSAVALKPVPNLIGEVYEELDREKYPDFEITLADYDYSDEYEAGVIMDQTPEPDESVAEGTEIKVYVSQGSEKEDLPAMQDLVGTTQQAATDYLDKLGLVVLPKEENSDTVEAGKIIRTEPAAGEPLEKGQTVTIWVSIGEEVVMEYIPTAVNKTYENALKVLNEKGFMNVTKLEEESKEPLGTVLRQSVEPGTKLDVTQEVVLYVSKGMTVPNVLGKSFADAQAALNEKGFYNITKAEQESAEPKDRVLSQSAAAGAPADTAQQIVLTVSKGTTVPSVVGKSFEDAKAALSSAGYNNVVSSPMESNEPKNQVVKQSVEANTQADPTTQITLYVSTGPKVTKKVTISLPTELVEAYQLTIMLEGQTIVEQTIQPGTPSITVDMVGRGTMQYEVYINGLEHKTDKVNFDS